MNDCLFCDIMMESKVLENKFFYAVFDRYPVNLGHLIIISKKHIPDLFGLDEAEFKHLYGIINQAKEMLDMKYKPAGYNIGVNCGDSAGQTILHFHIHIIPRYKNDIDDPRGGVRNIMKPLVYY